MRQEVVFYSIFHVSVPKVLVHCAEFIESHGIIDGIYRLCGIASNIQRLRYIWNKINTSKMRPCIDLPIPSLAGLLSTRTGFPSWATTAPFWRTSTLSRLC